MHPEQSDPRGTIGALSRGDTQLKITGWPQALVIIVGIMTAGAVLVLLVNAGWSAEGIAAMVALALGNTGSAWVISRRTAQVDAKTDQQTDLLQTVVHQTNGMSEDERQDVAERAAAAVVRQFRGNA